jgi:protochlorophyllide reductase
VTGRYFFANPYHRWQAYCQSKLANLLFTAELQRRLAEAGAQAIAVAAHPGVARTDLGSEGHGISNRLTRIGLPLTGCPAASGALRAPVAGVRSSGS